MHAFSTSSDKVLTGSPDENIEVTGKYPAHKFHLLIGGECVSRLTIHDFRQQIGTVTLRMGGIGGVATEKEHRFKGYSRRVIESSLKWMRMSGFDTSLLFGISSFYPKFGYAPAFPEVSFALAVRDAELVKPRGYGFVNYKSQYLRSVLNMYHKNNAERTGPIRRHPKHWEPFRRGAVWSSKPVCKVALNEKKMPVGYFVYDAAPLKPVFVEIGFAMPDVFPDILRAIARIAWNRRLERIEFLLPEDDAFIAFCRPLGLIKTVNYRKDGGGMVRMINVFGAFGKLAPLLAPRLDGRGQMEIDTDIENIGLSWAGGKLNVYKPRGSRRNIIRIPQWALAQLIYGYRTASSLADAGSLKAPKRLTGILENLFPATPHYFYCADKF